MLENLLVYAIVALCAGYALAKLAPRILKQACLRVLLRLPLSAQRRHQLEARITTLQSAGCNNCGSTPPQANGKAQPVVFYKKTK